MKSNCTALLLLLAAPAFAEDAARAHVKAAPARRVLKLDEVTVEGRIQKPQAFFILQRSSLDLAELEKKESFLPRIQKSCEKDPF
jgi:hypothetical protein